MDFLSSRPWRCIMARLGVFLLLVATSVGVAALFGAVHNQVSYTVGPDYFHQFKFLQFGIPAETPPRLGAAQIGFRASWWMGLFVGLPPFLLGLLLLSSARQLWRVGVQVIIAVILITALAAAVALVFGQVAVDEDVAAVITLPDHISDPVGFLRAGIMHDASYLGGFIGIFVGVWIVFRASRST